LPGENLRIGITQNEHDNMKPGPWVESTRTFIKLLWHTGSHTGACLIGIYAFGVPALKLILIVVGEVYRCSENKERVRLSRRCLLVMRVISKWAAPDMMLIILLYHLVRQLSHLPIECLASFDAGFTCYSVFIITCAITSHEYPIPEVVDEDADKAPRPPMVVRLFGEKLLFLALAVSAIPWVVVFIQALTTPCFGLTLREDMLVEHADKVVKGVLGYVDLLKLAPPVSVSLWHAAIDLAKLLPDEPDLNILLAFMMLMVFSIIFTALSMLSALMVTYQIRCNTLANEQMAIGMITESSQRKEVVPISALSFTSWFDHMSLLDVACMGVIIVTLCASIYKDYGIELYMLKGVGFMIASEVLRHFLIWQTQVAAEYHLKTVSKTKQSTT